MNTIQKPQKTYAWAVMDQDEPPDVRRHAYSVHDTFGAAATMAKKMNRRSGRNSMYVIDWNRPEWGTEPPAPEHYPCDRWALES